MIALALPRFRIIPFALVCGLVLAGCRSKPTPQTPVPEVIQPTNVPPVVPDSTESADAARRAAEQERLERERMAREVRDREMRILAEPVHFAFDRSDLSELVRLALDAKLRILLADQSLRIRVDGHTDDRGSGEYNIALGHRRAAAVRRYLVQRDIAEERIEIVSFGEERRVCTESTEGCWQQNRRAEVAVVIP